jgi:hypothetical protein
MVDSIVKHGLIVVALFCTSCGTVALSAGDRPDNGFAKVRDDRGSIIQVNFKDRQPNGHGTVDYSNGDHFDGEFVNGAPVRGVLLKKFTGVPGSESRFEGTFRNGIPAIGIITYIRDRYTIEGDFSQGNHRPGLNGENDQGEMNGIFKVTYPDGRVCTGSFVDTESTECPIPNSFPS